jgi:L-ascorbate metabolism protein UlaG (beta-lactamase superfamily)
LEARCVWDAEVGGSSPPTPTTFSCFILLFCPLMTRGKIKMIITRISKSSWFKIKTADHVIHFDPGYIGYFQNQGIPEKELEEKADLVFITHFHMDHLQPEALNRISDDKTIIVAPISCTEVIDRKITVVKPDESLTLNGIQIKTTQAYNTPEGRSTKKAHHKGDFVGYTIVVEDKVIYHTGDTDLIPEMGKLGKVDVALLPVGGTYTMDMEEALNAVKIIQPKLVIPMHESDNDLAIFKEEVAKSAIASRVVIFKIGEKKEV